MSFNLIRSICCCQLRLFFIYFFVHICLRQLFATSQRWRQRTKDEGRRQKVEGRIVIEPRNFSNSAALSCKWTAAAAGKGCELPADAALCFFQLRLTCVYGTSSFPVTHSPLSLLLPLQFVSCDKSSWKLRIWKSGESKRVQGKFNPGRGVANFQLWQLAPNRITLFPQFSCATAEEEGSAKISFRQLRWFWLLEIACDINRFDDALLLVLIEKFLGTKIEKYSTKRQFNKGGSKD